MTEPDDISLDPDEFVKLWYEYGLRFSVFVPDHQPKPDTWEPDVEEFDEKGRTNAHYLKHWKFLSLTKEFVRDRYAQHWILRGPTLYFDCLVPKFQNRMYYERLEGQFGPDFYSIL